MIPFKRGKMMENFLVFMDESGFVKDGWKEKIDEQPYYVVSAFCIPTSDYYIEEKILIRDIYNVIGDGWDRELKAKDVAKGVGIFSNNEGVRNYVREYFLRFPRQGNGFCIVTAVDKRRHLQKYGDNARDAYILAVDFVMERVQMSLARRNAVAICIYDMNFNIYNDLSERASSLRESGSQICFPDQFGFRIVEKYILCERILAFSFADSRYHVGLKVADFFAHFTYQYLKKGMPQNCGWWATLRNSLEEFDGRIDGVGLKIFP